MTLSKRKQPAKNSAEVTSEEQQTPKEDNEGRNKRWCNFNCGVWCSIQSYLSQKHWPHTGKISILSHLVVDGSKFIIWQKRSMKIVENHYCLNILLNGWQPNYIHCIFYNFPGLLFIVVLTIFLVLWPLSPLIVYP